MTRTRQILTVQASDRNEANSALEGSGFGPDNFSVPIIPETRSPFDPPPSHFGCNWGMTTDEKADVESALSTAGVTSVVWRELASPDPAHESNATFAEVMGEQGLKRLPVDSEVT